MAICHVGRGAGWLGAGVSALALDLQGGHDHNWYISLDRPPCSCNVIQGQLIQALFASFGFGALCRDQLEFL
jgi:hypothetical protein